MDLRPIEARPTEDERDAVDHVLGVGAAEPVTSLAAADSLRHRLLPALHAVQARVGWISPGALGYIAERLHVPPAEAFGVASFYAMFATERRAPAVAHVCDDIACRAAGAESLCASLTRTLGPEGEERDGRTWVRSPCLGLCEQAPAVMTIRAGANGHEQSFGQATEDLVSRALAGPVFEADARPAIPQAGSASLVLLRRIGVVDPERIDDYRTHGGYETLRHGMDLGVGGVLREITESGLLGRGGAAFPTGRKWEAVSRAAARPHYVVCNADESEPGTFKDRVLLEQDPFAVIEAMTLAGFATGAEKGYLYIRGEYPLATRRLANAVAQARTHGLLGDDVLGRGMRFDIEIRRGAGAYICGEETALFNSIEGYRGEPRNKPPFPVEQGLFGKPTCVNNVETLVSALEIVRLGAAAWRTRGTTGSTGTKLFCVSGCVQHPGVFEVPFGTTLRELLTLAGGARPRRTLRSVLLGGASGVFIVPDEFDVPLTFEDTRKIKATIGSGVVMAFDDSIDPGDILARIASFFRDESCGQCVPCRIGTVRVEELVARLRRGAPLGGVERERTLLRELGHAMADASICGLGQTATSAIESAVTKLHLLRGDR